MSGYFHVLTAIDIFVLSFMCILTKLSESLNKKQKRGFFLAFTLIAGISVLEVVTLAVNDTPSGLRWLNIVSNYLGFGLSPAVSLCLVYVLDKKTALRRGFKAAVCCEIAYLIFLALSIPYGLIFSVSADNVYTQIFLHLCHCLLCGNFGSLGINDHYRPRVSEPEPGAHLSAHALSDGGDCDSNCTA